MNDQRQIEARIQQFIVAFHAGDLDALLDTYSPDLIKARDAQPDETKSQTAARLTKMFQDYDRELTVRNDEIVVRGDLALVRGRLELKLTPRNGDPPLEARRRFIEIWRKETGVWRVTRTMDNKDSA